MSTSLVAVVRRDMLPPTALTALSVTLAATPAPAIFGSLVRWLVNVAEAVLSITRLAVSVVAGRGGLRP